MTLSMADSTNVDSLPAGFDAYLGYADGQWATYEALKARFPGTPRVILTVTGAVIAAADGCDCETGDLSPAGAAHWARLKLGSEPASRPVIYASISTMPSVLQRLELQAVARDRVRLLSAHYDWAGPGGAAHICGPATCAWPGVPSMDGTQWTSTYGGLNGSLIDMSMLGDSFFGPTWTEKLMTELPVVRQGDTGEAVRRVQALCLANGAPIKVDGIFGPETASTIRAEQNYAKIPADGVVGPLTWPVLLGIA